DHALAVVAAQTGFVVVLLGEADLVVAARSTDATLEVPEEHPFDLQSEAAGHRVVSPWRPRGEGGVDVALPEVGRFQHMQVRIHDPKALACHRVSSPAPRSPIRPSPPSSRAP